MRAVSRLALVSVAVVLGQAALGCASSVEIDGRPCPCVAGFVCCERLLLCYTPEQAQGMACQAEGMPESVSPPDAASGPEVDGPSDAGIQCPTGEGWQRCPDDTCVQNGCCSDDQCGVCQSCTRGTCQNQNVGQDRRNECAGRGCSASGSCRQCLPAELPVCSQDSRPQLQQGRVLPDGDLRIRLRGHQLRHLSGTGDLLPRRGQGRIRRSRGRQTDLRSLRRGLRHGRPRLLRPQPGRLPAWTHRRVRGLLRRSTAEMAASITPATARWRPPRPTPTGRCVSGWRPAAISCG